MYNMYMYFKIKFLLKNMADIALPASDVFTAAVNLHGSSVTENSII